MGFHAADFLAGLFDGTATDPDAPGPEPQAVPTAAAGGMAGDSPALGPVDAPGDRGGDVQPQGQPTGDGPDFAKWVLRPDARGRMGWEPPDVPDAERWWTDLPAAGEPLPGVATVGGAPSFPGDDAPPPPCPRCGSLELWWDLLGQPHCQHCDAAAFERSRRWLERAERIRRRMAPAPVST